MSNLNANSKLNDADFIVLERIVNDVGSTHQHYHPNQGVSNTPVEITYMEKAGIIVADEFDHSEFRGMVVPHWRITEVGIIMFKEYVYRRMCDLGRLGHIVNQLEKSNAR